MAGRVTKPLCAQKTQRFVTQVGFQRRPKICSIVEDATRVPLSPTLSRTYALSHVKAKNYSQDTALSSIDVEAIVAHQNPLPLPQFPTAV